MSALGDVIARIRAALGKISNAQRALGQAGDYLGEANQYLAHSLDGSHAPEAEQALGLLVHASTGIDDASGVLVEVEGGIQGYVDSLTGGTTENPPPAVKPGSPRRPEPASSGSLLPERIEQLRDELPPDIVPVDQRSPNEPRRKTHGRWIGPDGQARPIVSGEDRMYAEAVRAFPALGLRRGLPRRASDVEMKLAAYMRNHGIRSATVVLNNTPCPGPFGCDELVPVLLPEGCTLTVYGPNDFAKTYHGGRRPPWRKD